MRVFRPRTLVATSVIAVALVIFLFLPVMSYAVSIADPDYFDARALSACGPPSNSTSYRACAEAAVYPPANIHGSASLSYSILGVGPGPFPDVMLATQGNRTLLVHFSGASISYLERLFSPGFDPATVLNPSGIVEVGSATITQWAFGLVNFTARVSNVGARSLSGVYVGFHYPTFGKNGTLGSLTVYGPPVAKCATVLPPGARCTASLLLNQSSTLLTDQSYQVTVEVTSQKTAAGTAGPFLFLSTVSVRYPGVGLNSDWVKTFIQTVNTKRNGTALTENRTLDEFAAFRYDSLRAQYQISDYNFSADYQHFFGPSGPAILEEILYPNGRDPTTYPAYLSENAPGHYAGLMDQAYTKFGYFFGTGPSVDIGPGCTATEIPGPNINITEYVVSHGCSYVIADEIWFILVLGY